MGVEWKMKLYSLSPKRCLLQYPQSSEVITISSFLCLLRNMFYKRVCIQMFNMRAHTFFFHKRLQMESYSAFWSVVRFSSLNQHLNVLLDQCVLFYLIPANGYPALRVQMCPAFCVQMYVLQFIHVLLMAGCVEFSSSQDVTNNA